MDRHELCLRRMLILSCLAALFVPAITGCAPREGLSPGVRQKMITFALSRFPPFGQAVGNEPVREDARIAGVCPVVGMAETAFVNIHYWYQGYALLLQYRAGQIHRLSAINPGQVTRVEDIATFRLPGLPDVIAETMIVTHRGTAFFTLLAIRSGRLHRLMSCMVEMRSHGDRHLRPNSFRARYEDVNTDGRCDVILSGMADELKPRTAQYARSFPWQRVYVWDAEAGAFKEDPIRREGLTTPGREIPNR